MKTTPRELRLAVLLAVTLTAIAMMALLDPSCRPLAPSERHVPTR